MTLLTINQISKSFGSRDLFTGISFSIESGRRYALVGANGAGKSTLARILTGSEDTTEGSVQTMPGIRASYVPQNPDFSAGADLLEVLYAPWEHLRIALRGAEERLASAKDDKEMTSAMSAYQRARDEWDAIGGDDIDQRATAALDTLGVPGPYNRPVSGLSGGEAGLLALAGALAAQPDLLILDEPGNHLDFTSLAWLEAFLERFGGSLLIISHNRYLMDRLCDTVFELENGFLEQYSGNYSDYRLTKLRDRASAQATRKARLKHVERLEELVNRFEQIARRIADPAWGKRLRARRSQLELARNNLGEAEVKAAAIAVRFGGEVSRAEVAVRISGYRKSFGDKVLFDGASAEILSREKVALVGPNGCGKTTLIMDLLNRGDWHGTDDTLKIGPSFRAGYMAQNIRLDKPDESLEDFIRRWGALSRDEAFDQISSLGFLWDDLKKPVGILSGGEMARVQLARLNYEKADLLILDEPTNHLDAFSREAVEDALSGFPGTILTVSHDRYFLDKFVDRIIEVESGRLVSHPGGFSDWWADRGIVRSNGRLTTRAKERVEHRSSGNTGRLADLEGRIERYESEKAALEDKMKAAYEKGDHREGRSLAVKLDGVNKRLKDSWDQWESLASG